MSLTENALAFRPKSLTENESAVETSGRYKYSSIQDITGCLRLMNLQPGRFGDEICCDLITTRLEEAPPYEALSYVWGDLKASTPIHCEGLRLDITSSLAIALRHLRSREEARILFVDAICIDQNNLEERSSQVRQMAEIFHAAECVLIWLGPYEREDTEFAFDHMHQYAQHVLDVWKSSPDSTTHPSTIIDFKEWSTLPPEAEVIPAISDLLRRPWFTRVWILQEAAVARRATVICGLSEIALADVALFAFEAHWRGSFTTSLRHYVHKIDGAFSHVWTMYDPKDTWWGKLPRYYHGNQTARARHTVHLILREVFYRHVKDERDRIYAMLGHITLRTKDGTQPLVKADYRTSYRDLCHDLTVACLEQKQDWSILSITQRRADEDVLAKRPTWVADLRKMQASILIDDDLSAGTALTPCLEINDQVLHVKGIEVGSVSCPVDAFPHRKQLKTSTGATRFVLQLAQLAALDVELNTPRVEVWLSRLEKLSTVLHRSTKMPWKTGQRFLEDARTEGRRLEQLLRRLPVLAGHDFSTSDPVPQVTDEVGLKAFDNDDMVEYTQMLAMCSTRRVFKTKNGYWGLGPGALRDGDMCCIFNGSLITYILRPSENGQVHYFVGECFVSGIMQGEVQGLLDKGEVHEQIFAIE